MAFTGSNKAFMWMCKMLANMVVAWGSLQDQERQEDRVEVQTPLSSQIALRAYRERVICKV